MAKTIKSTLVVLITLLAIAGTIVYVVLTPKGGSNMKKRGSRDSQTVFSVKTEIAQVTTIHDYIATNGEIEAQSSIDVYPDIAGKVVSVDVYLGSSVRRGQVLARIDPSEPGAKYALSPVISPIDGSVIATPLKRGTTVTTNKVFTTIGDIDTLQVVAYIPERYIALLQTGLKADITLEAYPDIIFKATVTHISPVVDATSRTKEIILTFDAKDPRINAGMFAKVILYTLDYSDCIAIPGDAIITKGDKKYAFVVTPSNTVQQREVTLGKSVDGIYQILSGIHAGETVVVAGASTLSDGVSVRDITNGVTSDTPAAPKSPAGGKRS